MMRNESIYRAFMKEKGFTLIEILIAVLLLAIAIVPMLDAFKPAIFSTIGEEESAVFSNHARGTLNRISAFSFTALSANSGYAVDMATLFGSQAEADKETFSHKGTNYTPTVDITDVSGGDGGVFEITVSIDFVSLKTLKAEY